MPAPVKKLPSISVTQKPKQNTPPKAKTAPAITAPPIVPGLGPGSQQLPSTTRAANTGGATLPGVFANVASSVGPNFTSNPTGSGWNNASTNPSTGYMQNFGYTPIGMQDLYNNPQPLAQDVLGTMGIDNAGMSQQVADLFDSLLASQFVTNRGGSPSDDDTLNYIAQAMQQMSTPGGQSPDFAYYLNTLLNQTNPDANPLGGFMQRDAQGNALTPSQQTQTVNSLASQGLTGLNPYAQRGYSGALGAQGNAYQAGAMKGDPGASSYIEYLKQSPFANWF